MESTEHKRTKKWRVLWMKDTHKTSHEMFQHLGDLCQVEKDECMWTHTKDNPTDAYNQILLAVFQTTGPLHGLSTQGISILYILNPCTPSLYLPPKIHKPNNPGCPIVCSFSLPLSMSLCLLISIINLLSNPYLLTQRH